METSIRRRDTVLTDGLKKHPFSGIFMLCLLTEIFTLGDQKYMTPQAIMIFTVFSFVPAYYVIRRIFRAPQTAAVTVSALLCTGYGILLACAPRKGGVLTAAVVVIFLSALFMLYRKKQLTADRLTFMITAFSFCMYACYVVYTLSIYRQTDVSYWDSPAGHAPYIRYFYEHNFALPDFDPRELWQFYHAPLFYWCCAALMKLVSVFGTEFLEAAEVSQIVTLFSACVFVIFSEKLFRRSGLKGYAMSGASAVICLCNAMLLMAGSISNDITAAAFELAAFYLALRWYDTNKLKFMIGSALCFGLGMMTKLSVWMAAPAMAFVFLSVFFREIRDVRKVGRNLLHFGAFLVISVPLSLWFPLRNLVRFGVPIGYVPDTDLYIGKSGFFERMFTIAPASLSTPLTMKDNYLDEYNPIFTLFKSGVDLQRFEPYKLLTNFLTFSLITSIILGVISFAVMMISLFRRKSLFSLNDRISYTILYFTTMISYVIFCFNYPYVCTENIRYVLPVLTISGLYTGLLLSHEFRSKKLNKLTRYFLTAVLLAYAFGFTANFVLLPFD